MKPGTLILAAFFAIFAAGCGTPDPDCGPCPEEGCLTLDSALDSWGWLILCCSKLYDPEKKDDWMVRWQHVPPDWIMACSTRQTCTDYGPGWTNCSDRNDPITWDNPSEMDSCLVAQRTPDNAWCDGSTLTMCGGMGTSSSVDCDDFCGDGAGTCVLDGYGLATCSCGFPFVEQS